MTFDPEVILTCEFFKGHIFKSVPVEKKELHAFSGVQYCFKDFTSWVCTNTSL